MIPLGLGNTIGSEFAPQLPPSWLLCELAPAHLRLIPRADFRWVISLPTVATYSRPSAATIAPGLTYLPTSWMIPPTWRTSQPAPALLCSHTSQKIGAHVISGPGVVPTSWHISGTGDFDGNGQSDILWRND